MQHITSIKFRNYKCFKQFSISLDSFNILVGPNNAGKSTIIGAFKILAEGIRKAKSKKPTLIKDSKGNQVLGYEIDLELVPIATENIFHNYEEDSPATVTYSLSGGANMIVSFPERGKCFLNYESDKEMIRSPKDFTRLVNIEIGFVPILGPVDHQEKLYRKEAARLALLTYTASRNFRNIWYHYGEDFEEFRALVKLSWPGMDIDRPEINNSKEDHTLDMFCPEERIPREIFWAGFGFQVWCQMLTYIIKNKSSTIFIIDEPDIYLHSDLQRQLLGILRTLGPDIVIATHSTELISEAEINEILLVNKQNQSAKRIKDPSQLRDIFQVLGSNLNPVLTQIAKSKRILFVEGKDFSLFSKFARILNKENVANRTDFAVVPVEGFNPGRLRAFKEGIEKTIGSDVLSAVIFDRDYRSQAEVAVEQKELIKGNYFAHIHSYKEIENFILIPEAIEKAIKERIADSNTRSNKSSVFNDDIRNVFELLSNKHKHKILAQLESHQEKFERKIGGKDSAIIKENIYAEFDKIWSDPDQRVKILPGKEFISDLNSWIQEKYSVSISTANIINSMSKSLVPSEIKILVDEIDSFRRQPVTKIQ